MDLPTFDPWPELNKINDTLFDFFQHDRRGDSYESIMRAEEALRDAIKQPLKPAGIAEEDRIKGWVADVERAVALLQCSLYRDLRPRMSQKAHTNEWNGIAEQWKSFRKRFAVWENLMEQLDDNTAREPPGHDSLQLSAQMTRNDDNCTVPSGDGSCTGREYGDSNSTLPSGDSRHHAETTAYDSRRPVDSPAYEARPHTYQAEGAEVHLMPTTENVYEQSLIAESKIKLRMIEFENCPQRMHYLTEEHLARRKYSEKLPGHFQALYKQLDKLLEMERGTTPKEKLSIHTFRAGQKWHEVEFTLRMYLQTVREEDWKTVEIKSVANCKEDMPLMFNAWNEAKEQQRQGLERNTLECSTNEKRSVSLNSNSARSRSRKSQDAPTQRSQKGDGTGSEGSAVYGSTLNGMFQSMKSWRRK